MLRCGASVIATSRFPADLAQRFAAADDAQAWIGRRRTLPLALKLIRTLTLILTRTLPLPHAPFPQVG